MISSLRKRMMNMFASVFRPRTDYSARSQIGQAPFSKVDNPTGGVKISPVQVHYIHPSLFSFLRLFRCFDGFNFRRFLFIFCCKQLKYNREVGSAR